MLALPAGASRHVQVLRLQPGSTITLFNGAPGQTGGEYEATVTQMGRSEVQVQVGAHRAVEREARHAVHLAVGMPANDRMDWLVEKASELGVTSIQPLMTERSVLRLSGERADKKVAHWQSVAIAACEQCGGNRVPLVHPVLQLSAWLRTLPGAASAVSGTAPTPMRLLLSLAGGTEPLRQRWTAETDAGAFPEALFLSGPEGGLGAAEEVAAVQAGFSPVSLGPRVLRSETAALAALAALLL